MRQNKHGKIKGSKEWLYIFFYKNIVGQSQFNNPTVVFNFFTPAGRHWSTDLWLKTTDPNIFVGWLEIFILIHYDFV